MPPSYRVTLTFEHDGGVMEMPNVTSHDLDSLGLHILLNDGSEVFIPLRVLRYVAFGARDA